MGAGSDIWIVRLVVGFLGVTTVISAIGIVILTVWGHDVPNAICMFAAGTASLLAGQTRGNKNGDGNGSTPSPVVLTK